MINTSFGHIHFFAVRDIGILDKPIQLVEIIKSALLIGCGSVTFVSVTPDINYSCRISR
jgi:hypothetical protein